MASRPTRTSSRKATAAPSAAAEPAPTRATRSKAATTKPATTTTKITTAAAKKPATRKPLVNRANAVAEAAATTSKIPGPKAPAATRRVVAKAANSTESEREQIMAYLRIRPHLGEDEPESTPYLTHLSDTSVRMTDPQDSQGNAARFRVSNLPSSSIYTFSHIFPPNTTQSDFFTKSTLPLVKDVLEGQNGLLFTYGVTNSGKTYTVQGGTNEGSAGIVPRTFDVIFNSIEGLHGDGRFRPVRLCGIEPSDANDAKPPQISPEPAIAEVLGDSVDVGSSSDTGIDPTAIPLDRNYEYTIWLSYAEVYNEKVYDLLASVKGESGADVSTIPRSGTNPLLLSRQALPLKASPISDMDGAEPGPGGKYISGLRQFRVQSATQAKGLMKLGQLHRHVFGTLANRESSRSHGMVIIKVVRGHKGDKNDPSALQVSRLTLVDLAGSERTKHTQTTGDRLKEAGNINKSLMVLGQCMEIMRSNQRKLAVSLSQEGVGTAARMDTRDVKRGLAVVPFRHSKLTEALMDYFVGDGRTVMIVNVNPYDTGYDENSHVMKFAALAREVYVTPAPAPLQRIPTIQPTGPQGSRVKEAVRLFSNPPVPQPQRRKVTISIGGPGSGRKPSETVLEVVEEDEPMASADEEDDDESINPLVDLLFDEIESLRMQLFEAEMRCAVVEIETREEVIQEMEDRMRNMEKMYSKRLTSELERNEMKTDAKIDMLHQAGLFASPTKKATKVEEESDLSDLSDEEQIVENSLIEAGDEEEEGPSESIGASDTESDCSGSASPLHGKDRSKASPAKNLIMETMIKGGRRSTILREIRPFVPDPPMLPSDAEDAEMSETETAETPSAANSGITNEEDVEEDDDEEEGDEDYEEPDDEDDDEDEDEYIPEVKPATPKGKQASTSRRRSSSPKLPAPPPQSKGKAAQPRVSKLAKDLENLKLNRSVQPDDSIVIVPVKKSKSRKDSDVVMDGQEDDEENDDEIALVPAKKKKRYNFPTLLRQNA
ncbi:kinesin-domain-containing protein [Pluteus cervinus]|uniref:Kinesin-domain-containing protein n=1 Tax=Pluteus cervinus TaxID=181527 RepID=A0ACD3BF86_9AGAR|nr:kinesin-domain-containing protein [Pluteus cervinus]